MAGPDGSVLVLMQPAYDTRIPWVGFGQAPATGAGSAAFLGYGVEDADTYAWSYQGQPLFVWSQSDDTAALEGMFIATGGSAAELVASTTRVDPDFTLWNAGFDGERIFSVGWAEGCDGVFTHTWSPDGTPGSGACVLPHETGRTWYDTRVSSGGFGRAGALVSSRDDGIQAPWFAELGAVSHQVSGVSQARVRKDLFARFLHSRHLRQSRGRMLPWHP